MKFDVKARLFNFKEVSKSDGLPIIKEDFIKLLASQEYAEDLNSGRLMGLFTHFGRQKAREGTIPHADSIARDPDLVNKLEKIEVVGDDVYGYFSLVPGEVADRFKKLIKLGVKVGVSISTTLKRGIDGFSVVKLFGVDFTTKPDFASPIVQVNFSENEGKDALDGFKIQCVTSDLSLDADFSEGEPTLEVNQDFSLQAFLVERKAKPAILFKKRIDGVIRYMNSMDVKKVNQVEPDLISYFQSYLYDWMMRNLNDPEKHFNLAMSLRINQLVEDRTSVRDLQRVLNLAETKLRSQGSLDKMTQVKLNKSYQAVVRSIAQYINGKVSNPDKHLMKGKVN